MSDLDSYCREKAAPEGSNLYYGTLFEAPIIRPTLFSIFALHYEISESMTASPDPEVTRMKLHWWSEELQRLWDKQPRHPVTRAILSRIDPDKIKPPLIIYFDMIQSLLAGSNLYSVSDWKQMYFNGYGQIFSCANLMSDGEQYGDNNLTINGGAILVLEMLQSASLLVDKSFYLVPDELLEKYHIQITNLRDISNAEHSRKIFKVLLDEIGNELDKFQHYFFDTKVKLPLYHYIMNRIAKVLYIEIQSDGNRILEHKIALTPIRKLWITYKAKLKNFLFHRD